MNDEKRELRAALKNAYRNMSEADRAIADQRIIQRLSELPVYQACERVFLFASAGFEINTHDLIKDAYAKGKTVALPKSYSKGIMDFYEYTGSLSIGRFQIPEPDGENLLHPNPNDLMIVPGLAFTKGGHRIGYGGGYYDRYLAKHPCITIGLCRDAFLAKELPVAWNDLPVNCVITGSTVYECKNGASFEAPHN